MPLDTTNFHPQGPVKSVDLLQFYNLFTGVMADQPVTFSNTLTLGGNQGTTTVPLRIYGAVGQNTNLLDLYADKTQAQPGFGFSALGRFGWGPGGASPQDTFLSRIALQNGHSSDTPGLTITPSLEVTGSFSIGHGAWLYALAQPAGIGIRGIIRETTAGYAGGTSYPAIQIGTGESIALGVTVHSITGGNFNGNSELILPNVYSIQQVNSGGTDYINVMLFNNGFVTFPTTLTVHGDVRADRGNTTGYFMFGTPPGLCYIGFDGTNFQLQGGGSNPVFYTSASGLYLSGGACWIQYNASYGLQTSHNILMGGNTLWFNTNAGIYVQYAGGYISLSHHLLLQGTTIAFAGNGGIYLQWNGSLFVYSHRVSAPGFSVGASGTYQFVSTGQYWIEPGGAVIGASWQVNAPGGYTQTSHEKVKDHVTIIEPERWRGVLLDDSLRGLHYQRNDDPDRRWEYGFSADKWYARVPETVYVDGKGEASGLFYNSLIPFLWEAVRYLLKEREVVA